MKIRIEKCLNCGTLHEWEFTSPTLKELRRIKARTGLTGQQFDEASNAGDPDALTAFVDILHLRNGVDLRWDDIDLNLEDFAVDLDEDEQAEQEQGKDDAVPDAEPPTLNGVPNGADSTPKSEPTRLVSGAISA